MGALKEKVRVLRWKVAFLVRSAHVGLMVVQPRLGALRGPPGRRTILREDLKIRIPGSSLVVQRLGLCAYTAEGASSVPGGELRCHKPPGTDKKKKRKENQDPLLVKSQQGQVDKRRFADKTHAQWIHDKMQYVLSNVISVL